MIKSETVVNSWKTVREDTAQTVEEFPDLSFKPMPDVMSFGEISKHILDAGYGIAALVLDGVTNLAVPEFRPMVGQKTAKFGAASNAADLAKQLREAMDEQAAQFLSKPPEFFSEEITSFTGPQMTRLELLQLLKEHELTHRAQLFMFCRMKGIVPPTTRRRLAKAKA